MPGTGAFYTGALIAGYLSKSVAGSTDVTLTTLEGQNGTIVLTGAITASINVILPTIAGQGWLIINNTTGAFTVTVKTSGGTGMPVLQGRNEEVVCDGTNIVRQTAAPVNNVLTKSVAGAVDVTLTAAEAAYDIVILTGAITANINVIWPATVRALWILNSATGAFTLTVKGATGTGVVLTAAKRAFFVWDGTNMVRWSSEF